MPNDWRIASTPRDGIAKGEIAALAARQGGVIARRQLGRHGLGDTGVSRWAADQRLHRVHPGVYAVGHRALGIRGRLVAALLYAGPGAMLSHDTGGWWLEVRDREPMTIHVSTPRRRRGVAGVTVHGRRSVEAVMHRGLPVTSPAQTLLDLATELGPTDLRRAVSEAEYRNLIELEELSALASDALPGSAALREAVRLHIPQLARSRSVLEERFLALCQEHGIPFPQMNVRVCGLTVDALWPTERVIVELDGHGAHGTPARAESDRRRELRLRAAGFVVLRYTWQQVTEAAGDVAGDLTRALAA